VAKLAEVDMIIADLDRANSRIVALEHRNVSSFNFFFGSSAYSLPRKFCVQRSKLPAAVLKALNGNSSLMFC